MTLVTSNPQQRYQTILFREVSDDDEYANCLKDIQARFEARRELSGATVVYEGPPERRQIKFDRTWMDRKRTVTNKMLNGVKIRIRMSHTVKDDDGNTVLEERQVSERYFVRRISNYIVQGRSPTVFDLTAEAVQQRRARFRDDAGTHFLDMEAVPRRIREQLWEEIDLRETTGLQQFDTEDSVDFVARRLLGESRLELYQSIALDLKNAWLSVRCDDESKPIRVSAGLQVTEKTSLAANLQHLGRASSKLSRLSLDDEVLAWHWCSRIPKTTEEFLRVAVDVFRSRYSVGSVPTVLEDTIADGVLEAQLSMRADFANGLEWIGALRIRNDDKLRLEESLASIPASMAEFDAQLIHGESGSGYLRFRMEALEPVKSSLFPHRWQFVRLPEYCFLHATQGALWFACGNEYVWRRLEEGLMSEVPADTAPALPGRQLMTCRVNLEFAKWEDRESSLIASRLIELERGFAHSLAVRASVAYREIGLKLTDPDKGFAYQTVSQQALSRGESRGTLSLFQEGDGVGAEMVADRPLVLLYFGRKALDILEANRVVTRNKPERKVQTIEDVLKASEKIK